MFAAKTGQADGLGSLRVAAMDRVWKSNPADDTADPVISDRRALYESCRGDQDRDQCPDRKRPGADGRSGGLPVAQGQVTAQQASTSDRLWSAAFGESSTASSARNIRCRAVLARPTYSASQHSPRFAAVRPSDAGKRMH